MRIAVDAMGGDHAPEAVIEGVLLAKPQCSADLLLIGDEEKLKKVMNRTADGSSLELMHTPVSIGMGEAGPIAIRRKREASLSVAMRLLAENRADAVVSAGNSAAIVAAAKHFVGLIPGLRRPALAVQLPTPRGRVLLIDAGAHAEASSIHLAQSAALAHFYTRITQGVDRPRVGLLNIGQEAGKGMKVIQRAFALLTRSALHFVGNVEPHDLFADCTDAAVCDGFVGNIVLKMYEGLSGILIEFLQKQMEGPEPVALRECLVKVLEDFQGQHCYQNIGGAPLLGVRKTVVVAHGRSESPAIASAIHLTDHLLKEKVSTRMAEELEKDHTLADLKHQNALFVIEHLRNKWGFAQK